MNSTQQGMHSEIFEFIKNAILKVLHENSGGIKEIALSMEISKNHLEEFGLALSELFDDALDELQKKEKIGVLIYTWHMSEEEDAKREKRFIYTP